MPRSLWTEHLRSTPVASLGTISSWLGVGVGKGLWAEDTFLEGFVTVGPKTQDP